VEPKPAVDETLEVSPIATVEFAPAVEVFPSATAAEPAAVD